MRSAIACVVIVGAVACSSSRHGTEFLVRWNQKPTQVLLFVSTDPGSPLAIQPAGSNAVVGGTGWGLANTDGLDVVSSSGSAMTFFYEDSGSDVITKVYAVGMGSDDRPAFLASGVGPFDNPARRTEIVQYQLNLAPVGSTQVRVWGQPACLAAGSDYLVDDLANDPDCDGFRSNDPSTECVPDVYLGHRGPRLREATCTTGIRTAAAGAPAAACALGGGICRDGEGPGSGCEAPTAYCTPASACGFAFDAVEDPASAGLVSGSGAPPLTVLRCTFPGTVDNSTSFTPCAGSGSDTGSGSGSAVSVTVSGNLNGSPLACQDPLLSTASDGWGKTVGLGSGSDVSLQVDVNDPCKLTFTLMAQNGSFQLPLASDGDNAHLFGALFSAAFALPSANGSADPRGVALPLVIRLVSTPGCDMAPAPTCSIVTAGIGAGGSSGLDLAADPTIGSCVHDGIFPADTPPAH